MDKGDTARKSVVSIMLTRRIVPLLGSNPTQVKTSKLLVSLANLAVGEFDEQFFRDLKNKVV